MNIAMAAAAITFAYTFPVPSQKPAADITTRVIITNDPGFAPDNLSYINAAARQHAQQLHRITLLER
jgi:hypothetical protein